MENYNDTQTVNKLDEIKKIIFGEEIKSYNGELDSLRKALDNYRSEISVKIDEVKLELFKSIESVEQRLITKVSEAQNALRQELDQHKKTSISKVSLGGVFDEIAKNLAQ